MTNVVAVKLSDSDHSQSVSNSQRHSTKTSQSISQSLSAKQSQSVSVSRAFHWASHWARFAHKVWSASPKPISFAASPAQASLFCSQSLSKEVFNLNPLQRVNLYRQEKSESVKVSESASAVSVACSLLRYQQVYPKWLASLSQVRHPLQRAPLFQWVSQHQHRFLQSVTWVTSQPTRESASKSVSQSQSESASVSLSESARKISTLSTSVLESQSASLLRYRFLPLNRCRHPNQLLLLNQFRLQSQHLHQNLSQLQN